MAIDTRTIVMICVISYFIHAILIFSTAELNKNYRGLKYFGMGSVLFAVGFLFISMQGILKIPFITIVLGNTMAFLAKIFQYVAVMRLIEKKENIKSFLVIYIASFLIFVYFTFVNNDIKMRLIVVCISWLSISMLMVINLMKHRNTIYSSSINLLHTFIYLMVDSFYFEL